MAEDDLVVVQRILSALRRFALLKRELEWYRKQEPVEYERIVAELRKAIGEQ